MLSKKYEYESNLYKQSYMEGSINYYSYMNGLTSIRTEELSSTSFFEQKSKTDEIYEFELKQFEDANKVLKEKQKLEEERQRSINQEQQRIRRTEEERINNLSPDDKLYIERERYYKNEIPNLIKEYKREAKKYRNANSNIQGMIMIGSAIVTSTTGITIFTSIPTISFAFKIISAILSLIITISSGFASYFKYRERSINLQKTADDIEHEYNAIKLGTHPYLDKPRREALGKFADNILRRIKEHTEQQQTLEQPSEIKQIQPKS